MRIAHVLRLHSADAIFGGPTTVALNQLRELHRRGHETVLFTGWDGQAEFGDVGDVRAFPVRQGVPGAGLPGLVAPGLTAALRQALPHLDVVHIHLGRDLVTVPAGLAALGNRPLVAQTHGMIGPDRRLRARVLYRAGARRTLLGARRVLALTDTESASLQQVGVLPDRLVTVPNGVPVPTSGPVARPQAEAPVVLFCARLHPRKRVLAFAAMALELRGRLGDAARFVVAGPDDGDLAALTGFTEQHPGVVDYIGPVEPSRVGELMSTATVYVLPAVHEPVGMTVLEAMAAGCPAVVTDSCGLATDLARARAGVVTDGSSRSLADAVAGLLADAHFRSDTVSRGLSLLRRQFSVSAVVDRLESVYTESVAAPNPAAVADLVNEPGQRG